MPWMMPIPNCSTGNAGCRPCRYLSGAGKCGVSNNFLPLQYNTLLLTLCQLCKAGTLQYITVKIQSQKTRMLHSQLFVGLLLGLPKFGSVQFSPPFSRTEN